MNFSSSPSSLTFSKDFGEQSEGWRRDVFGNLQKVHAVTIRWPPSYKSCDQRTELYYHAAVIFVADQPSDRMQYEGDMGKIVDYGCTCSYSAGSLGK